MIWQYQWTFELSISNHSFFIQKIPDLVIYMKYIKDISNEEIKLWLRNKKNNIHSKILNFLMKVSFLRRDSEDFTTKLETWDIWNHLPQISSGSDFYISYILRTLNCKHSDALKVQFK